ncbi:MAG: energy-coupled thiamine transporter ThiT [Clostridia bacterium]|nr:energy-coupled thiamine transporter ThiT [Clostridia bacterium]
MKKLIALLTALLLALLLVTPALAEAADAAGATAEEAVETVEETAEAAGEAAAEAAEAVEEGAEEAESAAAVSPMFEKLTEVPWYTWVVLAALVVAGILLAAGAKNAKWDSRRLAMGAMCIAIAFVLSCIRLFRMPQGGSITPAAMLPLVMFMVACGPLQGFVVGCAFGLLQLITDPYVIHPIQLLVDYPLAYGAMILGCLVTILPIKKQWKLPVAALLAGVGRYVMAVLSGAIFFAEYAGEQNAWVYSLVYNISYIGPDVLVCMVVACIPGMSRLVDMIKKKG